MSLPPVEARYFGPADRPLIGWLHRPATLSRGVGLVVCNPFGYEAICSHRSLRHFAGAAAALGIPALRFDYDGTGDSAGDDRDAGRLATWVASVNLAIDELRRSTGVSGVCLLGVRLGGTLAALAAAGRDDVAGLAAIVPVVAGKAWLRELSAFEGAMGLAGPPPGVSVEAAAQEAAGYVITDETRTALAALDLLAMSRQPAPDVLVIDRDDLAANARWPERLAALGARVEHQRLPGYPAMMLDPHDAVVPEQMVAAVSTWLEQRGSRDGGSPVPVGSGSEAGPAAVAPGVEETAVYFGDGAPLIGILSAPARAPRPTRAVLMLNAGAISHVGPSRLYVDLARRWAARGFLVLRFDIAGIGESRPWPGESENVVYSPSAAKDIAIAVAWLRETLGASDLTALGLCSGAYHGFKAAVAGLPLTRVTAINPLVFFWKPGMSLAYPAYRVSRDIAQYKQSVLQLNKWKKVVTGQVNLQAFAQVMGRRVAQRAGALARDLARAAGRPLVDDLGAELDVVARRGIALRFVFATGDPGEDLLTSQAGSVLPRLLRAGTVRIEHIEGPNHSFTPVWSRTVLTELLEAELVAR